MQNSTAIGKDTRVSSHGISWHAKSVSSRRLICCRDGKAFCGSLGALTDELKTTVWWKARLVLLWAQASLAVLQWVSDTWWQEIFFLVNAAKVSSTTGNMLDLFGAKCMDVIASVTGQAPRERRDVARALTCLRCCLQVDWCVLQARRQGHLFFSLRPLGGSALGHVLGNMSGNRRHVCVRTSLLLGSVPFL